MIRIDGAHTYSPTVDEKRQIVSTLDNAESRVIFVEEEINVGLASQIRALQHDRGWTQRELGARAGMAQETISQLESPFYGRHTLRTLKRLAAAFDVALIVRFAPFSELVGWTTGLTRQRIAPPPFDADAGLVLPENGMTNTASGQFIASHATPVRCPYLADTLAALRPKQMKNNVLQFPFRLASSTGGESPYLRAVDTTPKERLAHV